MALLLEKLSPQDRVALGHFFTITFDGGTSILDDSHGER
jgi:hypothetical protein